MNLAYLLILLIFYHEFAEPSVGSNEIYNSSHRYDFYENNTLTDSDLNNTNESNCIDPSDLNLQLMLSSYEINMQPIYADDINETISISSLSNKREYIDKTNCHETQFKTMNERSICPYKHMEITKTNRFPWTIMGVKCTCDYCRDMSSRPFYPSLYKCSPKFQKEYVLVRDKCNRFGVYNWKESIEYVPKLCGCKIFRYLKTY